MNASKRNTKPSSITYIRPALSLNPDIQPTKPQAVGLTCRLVDGNTNGIAWELLSLGLDALGSSYTALASHSISASKKLAKLDLGTIHPDMGGLTMYAPLRAAFLPFVMACAAAKAAGTLDALASNPLAWESFLPPALAAMEMSTLVSSLAAR